MRILMNCKDIPRDMKLIDVYRMAIEKGIANDPRGKEGIREILDREKEKYEKLPDDRKECFDKERFWNPYADSRLSWGDEDTEVKKLMWGIDIGTGEVLLADRLREKGQEISGIVGHHPLGSARTPFPEVMWVQNTIYSDYGVPINVVEDLMKPRVAEVTRGMLPLNYNQAVDAARLLNMPIMNIHSPADNCVQRFMQEGLEKENPKYLKDIIDWLMTIPEFRMSSKFNSPPKIVVGDANNHAGRVIPKMNGGTSSPKEIYEKLSQAGVGTVVAMHFPESHIEEARKHHMNLIVSGHMASDSVGINLIADEWEKKGIEVIPCSGFLRVSRN